jgi:tRNA G37 N-methylase Trm5
MMWQIRFALKYLQKNVKLNSTEHICDDAIKIELLDGAEVIAIISGAYKITRELVAQYHADFPSMSIVCGYRKECIWEGGAITYAQENQIGWGNAGSLSDAVESGDFINAEHKLYFFSYRLIRQMNSITNVEREYDRVFTMSLRNGKSYRVGMIMEYEPTADAIRTFWDQFGPIDVAWNINPNGSPTQQAINAGQELGCEVVKWEEFKQLMRNR